MYIINCWLLTRPIFLSFAFCVHRIVERPSLFCCLSSLLSEAQTPPSADLTDGAGGQSTPTLVLLLRGVDYHGDQYKPALFSNAFAAETCSCNIADRLKKTQRRKQRRGLKDGFIAQVDALCGDVCFGDVEPN